MTNQRKANTEVQSYIISKCESPVLRYLHILCISIHCTHTFIWENCVTTKISHTLIHSLVKTRKPS